QSALTNFHFRLPILIFSTLSLLAFFYLSYKAFDSYHTALLIIILIATNPILLGMSQIINPDSFFWIFGGLSALAYLALLETQKKGFLVACGVLLGLALLSKYTAFILLAFFVLSATGKIIFQKNEVALKTDWKAVAKYIFEIILIFIISLFTFTLFLPAVFVNPDYLFKGISQFLSLKLILAGIGAISILALIIVWKRNIIGRITKEISKRKDPILSISLSLLSFLIIISVLNVWIGQKIAPVSELRDLAYTNEPKEFNFKPLLDRKEESLSNTVKLFLMEAYPFIFSVSPFLILLVVIITIQAWRKKISLQSYPVLFSVSIFTIIYFISTLLAHIVTNARYSIILYPLISIFGAIVIIEFLQSFKLNTRKNTLIVSALILSLGIIQFWQIKPFYFSYTNFLLPQKYTIHDSWGHGSYEAAEYLNALPEAERLIIWSNSDTVCRFFKGQCLRSRKINLNLVKPDYFVISKRGALKERNRFEFTTDSKYKKNSEYYFKNLDHNYVWQILIDSRPDNFIKIIKFEK
ncbi:MAG: glycosyltransferase family 39 protein, partial [Candidatus Moraniibacteriota bacterium]